MDTEPLGPIRVDEVLHALESGEIIEDYPTDGPYPSCLILGWIDAGRPLHIVCAPVPDERRLIVITAYRPDPDRWDAEFRRRRAP